MLQLPPLCLPSDLISIKFAVGLGQTITGRSLCIVVVINVFRFQKASGRYGDRPYIPAFVGPVTVPAYPASVRNTPFESEQNYSIVYNLRI
ncbi:hypothetical protein D3OALGA1CA_4598 [Olavius algarvensis associated proteobacterium Delta 3]|nr:hypothetical protein D3OALGB2SA_2614 [Olavius algarvensis associated proteobacterium Delta 3]CAB5153957.1 hypothetical protein D3OALGA1CA_4598 [Olavius algarvensis associated proteobacterium Delta 3]